MTRIVDKLAAILGRDLLTAVRYRSGFAMAAGAAGLQLAAFYYLSRAIGPGFRPEGMGYFPFVLVGTGFYTFLMMGISAFLHVVQEAQQTGTLEVLMTTATPAPVLVMLSAVSAFAGNSVQLLLYIGAGLLVFGSPLPKANWWGCVVVFGLSLGIAAAIGMLAAALQLAIQKGSAAIWLLGSGAWFMTGVLFPVGSLPGPLRALSQLIPFTHSLHGMRMALLEGANFSTLGREVGALAVICAVLLPGSLLVFSVMLRRARRLGTLSFY